MQKIRTLADLTQIRPDGPNPKSSLDATGSRSSPEMATITVALHHDKATWMLYGRSLGGNYQSVLQNYALILLFVAASHSGT